MSIKSVDNQNKVNKPLVVTTAVISSAAGGAYASTHLPKKNYEVMKESAEFPIKYLKMLMDSFDMDKAKAKFDGGNITKDTYETTTKIFKELGDTLKTQEQYYETSKKEPDFKTLRGELKKANKAMIDLTKKFTGITNDCMNVLLEQGILNKEAFIKTKSAAKENGSKVAKALVKPVGLGMLAGAFLGSIFGLGLSKLFEKDIKYNKNKFDN